VCANKLSPRHVPALPRFNCLPAHILAASVKCCQHGAGLVLSPVTVFLELLCPLFCSAKQTQQGEFIDALLKVVDGLVEENLHVETEERPDPAWRAYAEEVLEHCYYTIDLPHSGMTDEELEQYRQQDRRRRAEGEELMTCLSGNWKEPATNFKALIHHCLGPLCCPLGRPQSVKRTQVALRKTVIRRVETPALNRWLQVFPVVCFFALLLSIHGLFVAAWLRTVGENMEYVGEDSEGESLGAPVDATAAQRKKEGKRKKKAHRFLASEFTLNTLFLWLCVCAPVMQIHYKLFKASSNLSGMDGSRIVYELTDFAKSLPVKVMKLLASALDVTTAEHRQVFALLIALLGPFARWPQKLQEQARVCLLIVISQLWRRLVWPFTQWPMRLARLVDPDTSEEERQRIADEFFAIPLCCLDFFFSQKLRQMLTGAVDLLSARVLRFLRAVFSRMLVATTHLENSFAHMRTDLVKALRAPNATSIFANHALRNWLRAHKKFVSWYRQKVSGVRSTPAASHKCRPIWAQSKKRRLGVSSSTTSWNIFVERFCSKHSVTLYQFLRNDDLRARAKEEWRLAADEKLDCTRSARGRRAIARQVGTSDPLAVFVETHEKRFQESVATLFPEDADDECEGDADPESLADEEDEERKFTSSWTPWHAGNEEYPCDEAVLNRSLQATAFIKTKHEAWKARCGCLVEQQEMPEKVARPLSCQDLFADCCSNYTSNELDLLDEMKTLLSDIVGPRGVKVKVGTIRLLCLTNQLDTKCMFVKCTTFRKVPAFQAELIRYDGPCPPWSLPFSVSCRHAEVGGSRIPEILAEGKFLSLASQVCQDFDLKFYELTFERNQASCEMHSYTVTSIEEVDAKQLRETLDLARMHERAMKLLRKTGHVQLFDIHLPD